MAMFTGYFEVSVNFKVENQREKFITLISILCPIYNILIRSQNLFVLSSWIINEFFNSR